VRVTLNQIQEEPRLLTRNEAAAILRVGVRTFDRYAAEGKVPKVSLSARSVRFRLSDIEALVASSEAVAS